MGFIHGQRGGRNTLCTVRDGVKTNSLTEIYQHITPTEARAHLDIDDYFTFIFIRNPWDRLVSFYFWSRHFNEYKQDFEVWLGMILKNDWEYWRQKPYMEGCDFVGRYENLEDDLRFVFNKFGKEMPELPREKGGIRPPIHYRELYNDNTRQLVVDNFECFDYEF